MGRNGRKSRGNGQVSIGFRRERHARGAGYPARRGSARHERVARHLKVFGIAAGFGLAAYLVVLGLLAVSRRTGLLDWIAG